MSNTYTDNLTTRQLVPTQLRVRAAVPDDYLAVMEHCRALYAENGAVNVDWPTVEATVIDGVNGRQSCLGVIGPRGGELQGMIYLRISRMWYSQDTVLEELFAYVPPGFRVTSPSRARALLDFATDCSKRLNVPMLIGVISNARTEAKVRMYRRRLGPPAGAFFTYNMPATGGR